MKTILADTAPLVALFDRSEPTHKSIVDFIKSFKGEIITSWPVATEVTHLLDFSVQAQIDFLSWINRGGIIINQIKMTELETIIKMMLKYSDRPMDLADASLVLLGHQLNITEIITLDSDFQIYRLPNKKKFINLLNY